MLKRSKIKLWIVEIFCQRGEECVYFYMRTSVLHHCPMANSATCDPPSVAPFIPVSASPSVFLHLFFSPPLLHVYPWTATSPRVASLASMAQASTLKKCKAADQSSLERRAHRGLSVSLFYLPQSGPARPALMLPAGCGGRYRCVITPDREQDGTQVPRGSLRVQQAQCWSRAAQGSLRNISALHTAAPSKFHQTTCSHF